MTMPRAALAGLGILALSCARPPHPWSDETLCQLERESGSAEVDADAWYSLILRGYDAQTRRVTSPAVDCTGAQVRWEAPALACSDNATAKVLLPDKPLTPDDVVVSKLSEDVRIVWVVTNRYATGGGLGPVAVVEVKPYRLTVRAIGALRANTLRPKLRLEKLGAIELLVAEGEACASADPASCHRAARLMPYRGGRFAPDWLVGESGACLSPAWIDLAREESIRLENGWRRRFALSASLVFEPAILTIQEQVVVHDIDPRQPQNPPRLFRRAQADRAIRAVDGRLVASGTPLWAKMLNAAGEP
jgi:hypothetical protein